MFKLWLVSFLLLAVASVSLASGPTLTVDVRAVSTSSGSILDAKHVEVYGGAGTTVTMDVWSVVSGQTNSNNFDDILDYLYGSFLSSNGGLLGNLRASLEPNYDDFVANNGRRQDLDGDTDVDVGSNSMTTSADYFAAFSGQFAPSVAEDRIATLTFTLTDGGTETLVNFRPLTLHNTAHWYVDAIAYEPSIAPFVAGAPVEIAFVPEPATTTTLAVLCGFAITRRWRRFAGNNLWPLPL